MSVAHGIDLSFLAVSPQVTLATSTPVNPTGVYPHMPIAGTAPFVTSQGHAK